MMAAVHRKTSGQQAQTRCGLTPRRLSVGPGQLVSKSALLHKPAVARAAAVVALT